MSDSWQRKWQCLPRGLFWRVFATIGIAAILSAIMSFGLFFMSATRNLERVFAQDYTGLTAQVRQALDNGTLIELQTQFQEEKHAMLVVLEGRHTLGKPPPLWVIKKIRRPHKRPQSAENRKAGRDRESREDRESTEDHEPRDFELMQTRFSHAGNHYRIILLPTTGSIRNSARPLGIVLCLAMLTLVSSIIAWMFTRPIRQVQSAARQLSTGDTSARVPDEVALRRDSIGELGSDFNHMAERIQHLLNAQQQLLRDVSHELRTPLARMQVALVLAQDSPHKAVAHMDRIESEIERLNTLIGSILSLSKAESGATALTESTFELNQLIGQIAQDAEFEFANQGKTIDVHCPSIRLTGDREQLRSGLENITRNAMRYSNENSTVSITAESKAQGLELRVKDCGPGVPEQQLPRLFEAFFRADSARCAEQTGGHGVGLAITRSIVKLHGGTISARNASEGGLEVIIKLPPQRLAANKAS